MDEDDKKLLGIAAGAAVGAGALGAYYYYKTKNILPDDLGDISEGLKEAAEKAKQTGAKVSDYVKKLINTGSGVIEQPVLAGAVVDEIVDQIEKSGIDPSAIYTPIVNGVATGGLSTSIAGFAAATAAKEGLYAGIKSGYYIATVASSVVEGGKSYIISKVPISESTLATFKSLNPAVYGLATAYAFINDGLPGTDPSVPDDPADPENPPTQETPGDNGDLWTQFSNDWTIKKNYDRSIRSSVSADGWITLNFYDVEEKDFYAGWGSKKTVRDYLQKQTGQSWSLNRIIGCTTYYSDYYLCCAYLNSKGKITYSLLDGYTLFWQGLGAGGLAEIGVPAEATNIFLFKPRLWHIKVNIDESIYQSYSGLTFWEAVARCCAGISGNLPIPELLVKFEQYPRVSIGGLTDIPYRGTEWADYGKVKW